MIKMAIIGFGSMANWHFENIRDKIPEIKIAAAYDIRKEARDKIAECGIKSYASPEELYDDKEIGLVLIATPNDTHMPYAVECLKAGKHVISEKPVALCAAELEKTIRVSKETGGLFTVHQNRRWDSDFLTIKKILDDGLLKDPYTVESRVQGSRQGVYGWRGHKINGGGMLLDWGIHLIDQMLWLFPQKVVSVAAHLHSVFSTEVDDNFTSLLRFEGGLTALINVAMNCFIPQPRWHMCCGDGTAIVEDWEVNGKIVKLREDADEMKWDEEIVYTAAGPTRSMAPRPRTTIQELALPSVKGEWTELYRNILDTLDGKAELIVKPEQSLRVMKVVDAMFEADKRGECLKCEI